MGSAKDKWESVERIVKSVMIKGNVCDVRVSIRCMKGHVDLTAHRGFMKLLT